MALSEKQLTNLMGKIELIGESNNCIGFPSHLSLEEQDAMKLAALFASEEDEDKKVK